MFVFGNAEARRFVAESENLKPSRGVFEGATMDQPSWMQNTGQASGPGANAGGAPVQQAPANQSGDA